MTLTWHARSASLPAKWVHFLLQFKKKEIATCLKVANTFDKKISDNALDFYSWFTKITCLLPFKEMATCKKVPNTFSKNWVYENALDFHSWFENYMRVTIKKN